MIFNKMMYFNDMHEIYDDLRHDILDLQELDTKGWTPDIALEINFERCWNTYKLNHLISRFFPGIKYLYINSGNYVCDWNCKNLPTSLEILFVINYQGEIYLDGIEKLVNLKWLLIKSQKFDDPSKHIKLPESLELVMFQDAEIYKYEWKKQVLSFTQLDNDPNFTRDIIDNIQSRGFALKNPKSDIFMTAYKTMRFGRHNDMYVYKKKQFTIDPLVTWFLDNDIFANSRVIDIIKENNEKYKPDNVNYIEFMKKLAKNE